MWISSEGGKVETTDGVRGRKEEHGDSCARDSRVIKRRESGGGVIRRVRAALRKKRRAQSRPGAGFPACRRARRSPEHVRVRLILTFIVVMMMGFLHERLAAAAGIARRGYRRSRRGDPGRERLERERPHDQGQPHLAAPVGPRQSRRSKIRFRHGSILSFSNRRAGSVRAERSQNILK